jgi:hypothetical protein
MWLSGMQLCLVLEPGGIRIGLRGVGSKSSWEFTFLAFGIESNWNQTQG